MNSPFGPNSSSCAAVGAYAGPPALFERVNTKTYPFEFTATPGTSPKFMPPGSLRKSAVESKEMSGTLCCASAGAAASRARLNRIVFIEGLRLEDGLVYLVHWVHWVQRVQKVLFRRFERFGRFAWVTNRNHCAPTRTDGTR